MPEKEFLTVRYNPRLKTAPRIFYGNASAPETENTCAVQQQVNKLLLAPGIKNLTIIKKFSPDSLISIAAYCSLNEQQVAFYVHKIPFKRQLAFHQFNCLNWENIELENNSGKLIARTYLEGPEEVGPHRSASVKKNICYSSDPVLTQQMAVYFEALENRVLALLKGISPSSC